MELDNQNPIQATPDPVDDSTEATPVASAVEAENPTEAESVATLNADEEDHIPSASEEVSASDHIDEEADDAEDESASNTSGVKRGELLEGIVTEKNDNEVLVDLGNGVTGVVPNRELQYLESPTAENLEIGTNLAVYVLKARGGNAGMPLLSISRALEEQDWRTAEGYSDTKNVFEGRIAGYNKGGLIVRFGRLRGFIPASQISQEREQRAKGESPDQRWSDMLNEAILMKVVEVNRQRNRLILSERAATREIRDLKHMNVGNDTSSSNSGFDE